VSDPDELLAIRDLLYTVKSDVITLVTASGGCDGCTIEDPFAVISAEYQLVAGKNYRVHLGVGYTTTMKQFDIEFFVPLPVDGVAQDPTDFHMLTTTTTTTPSSTDADATEVIAGGWQSISDADELMAVQQLLAKVKPDLVSQLAQGGYECTVDDDVIVQSAQRQVVAGTNYMAHILVAGSEEFDVSFFVALPVNDPEQVPTSLRVTSFTTTTTTTTSSTVVLGDAVPGGYVALTKETDLLAVRDMLIAAKSDVITLVSANGCDGCSTDDELTVMSAEYQIVAGTNYRVHLGVGSSQQEFDIKFFVPLPVNGVAQSPTDFEIVSTVSDDETTVSNTDADKTEKKLTQIYIAVSVVAFMLVASFVVAILYLRKRRNENEDDKKDTLLEAGGDGDVDKQTTLDENTAALDETL